MSEYGEGVRTGYETGPKVNPFSAYIKRVDEARARQLADQKDVQELKNLFAELEKKHEYDTQIEEQKRQVGLELEKEKGVQNRLNKLSEGYTFDESGNEVAPEAQPTSQTQPVDRNQRLLQMTGLAMPTKNKIDTSRPIINNPDGSFSTERTITIGMDGKYYNIPTIFNGKQVSPQQAIQLFQSGQNKAVGQFNSQQEAEKSAIARSQEIGRVRKPNDNSILAEQFGFGKGVKLKKKNDVEAQLKEENLKYMQSINKKMTEGDGTDLVYRKADTGEEVTKEEAEAAIANGDRNYLVNQRITTKSGTSEKPLIKPPDLTKEEKEYVNASRRIGEALGDMSTRFTEIAKSKKGFAGWKKAQVQMKLPFSLEYAAVQDQDLQYIKSSIDKVKADIPFLRGGKQLTNTEAKRIDILLNPFGKSDATIQRDIKRFQEEFSFGEKLMIGGVSAISRQGEPSKKIGRFTIESE